MSNFNNKKFIEELFTLHNKIREDPQSFIPTLEKELNSFKGLIWEKQIGREIIAIETYEGKKAVEEAINYLLKIKPRNKLELKEEISQIAEEHALDLGKNGLFDSIGSDGTYPDQRINKRIEYRNSMGESIDFNFLTAEDIVFSFLVDDGVEGRSRRINFFNPKFNFLGIAVADHPDFEKCCVIDYIGEIIAYKNTKRTSLTQFKQNGDIEVEEEILEPVELPDNRYLNKLENLDICQEIDDDDGPEDAIGVQIITEHVRSGDKVFLRQIKIYHIREGPVEILTKKFDFN